MEHLPNRIDSTFRYVLIAAKRAEQLVRGARPKLDGTPAKPARLAMREVVANLIDWDYGPPPAPEPVAPPAEEATE
jgi:DNA-directed RNA polymerase subunit omega